MTDSELLVKHAVDIGVLKEKVHQQNEDIKRMNDHIQRVFKKHETFVDTVARLSVNVDTVARASAAIADSEPIVFGMTKNDIKDKSQWLILVLVVMYFLNGVPPQEAVENLLKLLGVPL